MGSNNHLTMTVSTNTMKRWAVWIEHQDTKLPTGFTVNATSESDAQEQAKRNISKTLYSLSLYDNVPKGTYTIHVEELIV